MQWIYGIVAVIIIAVVSIVATPVAGVIVLLVLAAIGLAVFGLAGGAASRTLRTRPPEPTGRPRTATGAGDTANRRQGQE